MVKATDYDLFKEWNLPRGPTAHVMMQYEDGVTRSWIEWIPPYAPPQPAIIAISDELFERLDEIQAAVHGWDLRLGDLHFRVVGHDRLKEWVLCEFIERKIHITEGERHG